MQFNYYSVFIIKNIIIDHILNYVRCKCARSFYMMFPVSTD